MEEMNSRHLPATKQQRTEVCQLMPCAMISPFAQHFSKYSSLVQMLVLARG